MRNQFTVFAISLLIFAAVAFSALAQKDKENKGKGHQKEQTKDKGQQGRDKDNRGNKQDDNRGNDHKDKGDRNDNRGRGDDEKDKNKGDRGNSDEKYDKDNRGRDGKDFRVVDFRWTPENFRDRQKIRRGQEKVTLCHKPNRDGEPGVTITVSSSALKAHMNHGDVMGECPNVNNGNFSDGFIDRRSDYYNVLVNGQEQVIYSRSILDYALERLTGARSQLVTLQNSNTPAAELERKRLLVVELEDNVSVLRTLLGVTANLVANKLMD